MTEFADNAGSLLAVLVTIIFFIQGADTASHVVQEPQVVHLGVELGERDSAVLSIFQHPS